MENGLKHRLKNRELTIGSWITLAHTSVAEIMCRYGFDWLTIDMEHSAITLSDAQSLIQTISLCGKAPLVRVGENDPVIIKRVMDAGAHGVIVPMVNTKEEAEKAVASVKYPPKGFRGVGLARAQKYGDDFPGYKEFNERESIVIVQIEHIKAVENLSGILKTEGVDGFIIGPYDLSGSIGAPGDFEHPQVKEALDNVKKVSMELNSLMGYHIIPPKASELIEKASEGYRFLAFSLDTLFLIDSIKTGMSEIRSYLK